MTPTLCRGQPFNWALWSCFSYCHHCIAPSLCLRKFYSKVSGNSSVLSGPNKLIESAKEKIEKIGLEKHAIPTGVQKITTFPLTNTRKQISYERPKEGILNIDLFSNPLLKEKFSNFPSVSKILNETMSDTAKQALENWKIRMINLMGKEKFESFNQEQLNRGKEFHGLIKDAVMGKEVKTAEETASSRCFKSIEWILKDISEVAAVESFVAHPHLAYKGIFDCVAKYKGKPVLIEWKHSTKPKHSIHSTYDAPIQLSAYLGALNYDKNYNFRVEGGIVVVAHTDGSPADLFDLPLSECSLFWTLWLDRLTKFATTTKLS